MAGVQSVQRETRFGAAQAHLREQPLTLSGAVQVFGKLVDTEQHRPQPHEIERVALAVGRRTRPGR